MVKVFVIEDHATIIVAGLRNIFRPSRDNIEVTGTALHVNEALKNPELASSDLILLDLWIPGHDPLETMKLLGEKFPGKPVIIYTSEELPVWQQKMMRAGVKGYVSKNCNREDLKSAIMHVARGGTWFTGPMFPNDQGEAGKRKEFPELSPVERQIMELLVKGQHYHEISEKMNLTRSRIDKILASLRTRFECTTTVELVKLLSDQWLV